MLCQASMFLSSRYTGAHGDVSEPMVVLLSLQRLSQERVIPIVDLGNYLLWTTGPVRRPYESSLIVVTTSTITVERCELPHRASAILYRVFLRN